MAVSPELIAQYKAASDAKLQHILSIIDDPSWKQDKAEPEITFYSRSEPPSSFSQLKSIVTIPAPVEAILAVLEPIEVVNESTPKGERHGYVSRRAAFGPLSDESHSSVMYISLESPGALISGRDFLLSRFFYRVSGDRYAWVHTSIVNDALVPPAKGVVRGEMIFQAYVLDAIPEGGKLTFVVHADPKGSVPGWAYNATLLGQGYAAKGIRKKVLAGQAK
jgi:hypothetical protein